jgi:hypothetical protein
MARNHATVIDTPSYMEPMNASSPARSDVAWKFSRENQPALGVQSIEKLHRR